VSGRARAGWLCAAVLALLCVAPVEAGAVLVIEPGTTSLKLLNAAGEPENRAGSHPDRLIQGFKFTDVGGAPESPKEILFELPPGLSGDPSAVPFCSRTEVDTPIGVCPADSQVGVLRYSGEGSETMPVYNVEPAPNEVVSFAAIPFIGPFFFSGRLGPGGQGLSLRVADLENAPRSFVKFPQGPLELWGVPADHQEGTSIPRRALLTTPTRCDLPPISATVRMRTWQQPERWLSGTGDTGQQLGGCNELPFDPSLGFALDEHAADAPSGARIDVTVPQDEDPDGRATSQIRDFSVAMPEGMTLSPGGASGLASCSDAQFGLGAAAEPACPPASRVGSIEMSSPSLGKPLLGAVYLGAERQGERFRLLIAASAGGSEVKFAGSLDPDPATGRLTAILPNLPQASFDRMSLHFDGGPGALLATPLRCGPAATSAKFTPYSGTPPVEWTGSVSVTGPGGGACAGPAPFAPTFSGGSTSAAAGKPTSFTATVRRKDGEQLPERLTVALPAGMSAALGAVTPCPAAAAAAGTCAAASRVGRTVAELGPGTEPAQIEGDIFLTGPYRHSPFGLALVFKAALGPFELGQLVVRGGLTVDPLSGQVTITTDSLPATFEGLPIRFQEIGLDLDRPGFMRNPTSCAPAAVTATVRSQDGAVSRSSSPFAVRGCVGLPFRPAFSVALTGRDELRKEGRPGLRIAARNPSGDANLRSADVLLPKLLKFDPSGPGEICARRQAVDGACPKDSRIGLASGRTPLLHGEMKGSIYVVQPHGSGPPDLWAKLTGDGIEVNLRGETAVREGHPETKFVDIPDFPLASFALRFAGGKGGLLELKERPCGSLLAPTEMGAQNGARVSIRTRVATQASCGRGRRRH
jgi:hypothetical protein